MCPSLQSLGAARDLLQGKLVARTWHLLYCRGPEWHTGLDSEPGPTVKELLTELYVRVGDTRQWALVRYISGILKKKVEALDEVTTMQLASSRLRSIRDEAAEWAGKLWLHQLCLRLLCAEALNPKLLVMSGVTFSVPRPALTSCLTRST